MSSPWTVPQSGPPGSTPPPAVNPWAPPESAPGPLAPPAGPAFGPPPPPPHWSALAGTATPWQPQAPPRPLPPHAEPQPYHRILRTRTYRWWRPLLGVGVGFGVYLLLFTAIVTTWGVLGLLGLFDLPEDPFVETRPATLLVVNLTLAALIPASMLALLSHRLRPGWLGSVVARLRWRLFLPFGAIALAVTLASYGLSLLVPVDEASATEVGTATWQQWSSYALVVLLTTPLQSAGEEYLFRGYLVQAIGAWVRIPWVGILVTSVLFALAHGGQNPALFVDRFAFGLLAGWLVWRTGGLEASIAFHTVNNVVIFLISAAFDQMTDTLSVTDIPWSYAVLDIASMVVLGLLVHLYLRRRPVRRHTDAVA